MSKATKTKRKRDVDKALARRVRVPKSEQLDADPSPEHVCDVLNHVESVHAAATPELATEYCLQHLADFWQYCGRNAQLLCAAFGKPNTASSMADIKRANYLASHWRRVTQACPELCVLYAQRNDRAFEMWLRRCHAQTAPKIMRALHGAVDTWCHQVDSWHAKTEDGQLRLLNSLVALQQLGVGFPLMVWYRGRMERFTWVTVNRITAARSVFVSLPPGLPLCPEVQKTLAKHKGLPVVRGGKVLENVCNFQLSFELPSNVSDVVGWLKDLETHLAPSLAGVVLGYLFNIR